MKASWWGALTVMTCIVAAPAAFAQDDAGAPEAEFDYSALPEDPADVAKILEDASFRKHLDAMKISVVDAIKKAAEHVGGDPAGCAIEPGDEQTTINVDVWKGQQRYAVKIDTATGEIVSSEKTYNLNFPGISTTGEPVKTDSGLMYYDIEVGDGEHPVEIGMARIHWSAWLTDGKLWQTSRLRTEPAEIAIATLPAGWKEGFLSMRGGGQRKLIIPAALGFGSRGGSNVPPNAAMIVDIEMIEVLSPSPVTEEELKAARNIGDPTEAEFIKTDSGMYYIDLKEGDGAKPNGPAAVVKCLYTGYLTDGTQFDASRGGQPTQFGLNQVIKGWTEGVGGMKVNGKRKLVIPSGMAYAFAPRGGTIPPDATLIFDVELTEIVQQPEPTPKPAEDQYELEGKIIKQEAKTETKEVKEEKKEKE